jgi:hypothetical protein
MAWGHYESPRSQLPWCPGWCFLPGCPLLTVLTLALHLMAAFVNSKPLENRCCIFLLCNFLHGTLPGSDWQDYREEWTLALLSGLLCSRLVMTERCFSVSCPEEGQQVLGPRASLEFCWAHCSVSLAPAGTVLRCTVSTSPLCHASCVLKLSLQPDSFVTQCYGLNVCILSPIPMLKPCLQCGSIRKWNVWELIRIRYSHEDEALMNRISARIGVTRELVSSFYFCHLRTWRRWVSKNQEGAVTIHRILYPRPPSL